MAKEKVSEEAVKKAEQDLRKADLDKRAQAFNVKLLPLLQEFELALGAHPFMIQDPHTGAFQVSARPQIMDAKKWDAEDAPAPDAVVNPEAKPKEALAEA